MDIASVDRIFRDESDTFGLSSLSLHLNRGIVAEFFWDWIYRMEPIRVECCAERFCHMLAEYLECSVLNGGKTRPLRISGTKIVATYNDPMQIKTVSSQFLSRGCIRSTWNYSSSSVTWRSYEVCSTSPTIWPIACVESWIPLTIGECILGNTISEPLLAKQD